MDEVTITLWGWHERPERTRIMRAEHKATAKNLKSKKKQNEMQENIAKTEKDTKEALEKGEMPPSFKEMMEKSKEDIKTKINEFMMRARMAQQQQQQ